MVSTLKKRNHEGFELTHYVVPGERYSSLNFEGYTRALREVFRRETVTVPEATLRGYVGTYDGEHEYQGPLKITVRHGSLVMTRQGRGSEPDRLQATSPTTLFAERYPADLEFTVGDEGGATSVRLQWNDEELVMEKRR